MIPGVTCATCAFFSPPPFQSRFAGRNLTGQCRRHAPMMEQSERGIRTVWPLVHDNQWCGEHATPDTE